MDIKGMQLVNPGIEHGTTRLFHFHLGHLIICCPGCNHRVPAGVNGRPLFHFDRKGICQAIWPSFLIVPELTND